MDVSYSYYKTVYGGDLDSSSFAFYSARALREIEAACFGRIGDGTSLTDFQADCVKRAVCYETDYLAEYADAISSPVSSLSIGSTSLSYNNACGGTVARLSPDSAQLLEWSGLTCRVAK